MIDVKNVRTGEVLRGKSPESIARRLYGKRAWVRYSGDPNRRWQLLVLTPAPRAGDGASNIEAEWYADEAARAAAEIDEED